MGNVDSMATCALLSILVLIIVSLYSFFPQASSSTRKARSCTGSNEPFSHIDQSLPDPISSWTCSAIEALHPFIPITCSILIYPPPPHSVSHANMQPSRLTCVHHGDKAKRGRERGRERGRQSVSVSNPHFWFVRRCFSLSLSPIAGGAAQALARYEPL